MNDVTFRPYQPAEDEAAAFALWQATLGASWPLSRQAFHETTVETRAYKAGDHEVAESAGMVVGFMATQKSPMRSLREIMLLLVRPAYQRKGIGQELLGRAVERFKRQGVSALQLGGGGSAYFWPGVPENLAGALAFFEKAGWSFAEERIDMALSLRDYQTPTYVYQRAQESRVTFAHPNAEEIEAVVAFERKHFPSWAFYFEQPLRRGELVAKDAEGAILGSSLVMRDNKWEKLLPGPIGSVCAVGVAEAARGKGVGLALVARGNELLQEQGCESVWLGWTHLRDWYGKLGYTVWRSYRMS